MGSRSVAQRLHVEVADHLAQTPVRQVFERDDIACDSTALFEQRHRVMAVMEHLAEHGVIECFVREWN